MEGSKMSDTIAASKLHAALDEILSDKTEGVVLLAISADEIKVRAYGDHDQLRDGIIDYLEDVFLDPLPAVAYAH